MVNGYIAVFCTHSSYLGHNGYSLLFVGVAYNIFKARGAYQISKFLPKISNINQNFQVSNCCIYLDIFKEKSGTILLLHFVNKMMTASFCLQRFSFFLHIAARLRGLRIS